jgi:hypothetical protein
MTMASDTMNDLRKPPANEPWSQDGIRLTEEQLRARRTRSIAIAVALGAFVAVIFAVTIVRLGSGALQRPLYMQPVQPTQGTK